jgi:predicted RNA-binding protein YlqC (UPF0109 family)
MQKLIEYIVRQLVSDQEAVLITSETNEEGVTIKITVAQTDMGRIIGKQGRIAKAIRVIARASAKDSQKYNIEIIDPEKDAEKASE